MRAVQETEEAGASKGRERQAGDGRREGLREVAGGYEEPFSPVTSTSRVMALEVERGQHPPFAGCF